MPENWDSLINPGNQGTAPTAVQPPVIAPPANPSEAVAADPPAPSPEAKVTTDPNAQPVAEAKPASTDGAPAKVEPPATEASEEATVDPSKATASEDEETDEEKAEIAALPAAAQPAARRNRKEARQFRALKTAIGGEGFVEDAALIVPAFYAKPAAEFDAILQERSPLKATELYNHMVYTAIDGPQSRPILINELVTKYRSELETALGVSGTEERQPESRVEPSATANADTAAKDAASLATINELLADPYSTAEQKQALELAKSAITDKTATDAKLARIEDQLRILTDKDQTSQTQTVADQTQALGGEFIGEVMQFAGVRLNELGLSAADGDSPELVSYIEAERKKILDLLPGRFQTHENASKLISQLEEKFERIPTLANAQAKAAEKRTAWKFLAPVKVCVDDILGKEVASCLYAIETARGARQVPLNQDPRKELVGHEAPGGGLTPATTIVKGKGVDALWDSLTNPQPAASIPA